MKFASCSVLFSFFPGRGGKGRVPCELGSPLAPPCRVPARWIPSVIPRRSVGHLVLFQVPIRARHCGHGMEARAEVQNAPHSQRFAALKFSEFAARFWIYHGTKKSLRKSRPNGAHSSLFFDGACFVAPLSSRLPTLLGLDMLVHPGQMLETSVIQALCTSQFSKRKPALWMCHEAESSTDHFPKESAETTDWSTVHFARQPRCVATGRCSRWTTRTSTLSPASSGRAAISSRYAAI